MDKMRLKYQPKDMKFKPQTLIDSLHNLQNYVSERKDLWYTVIDQEAITSEWISCVTSELEF